MLEPPFAVRASSRATRTYTAGERPRVADAVRILYGLRQNSTCVTVLFLGASGDWQRNNFLHLRFDVSEEGWCVAWRVHRRYREQSIGWDDGWSARLLLEETVASAADLATMIDAWAGAAEVRFGYALCVGAGWTRITPKRPKPVDVEIFGSFGPAQMEALAREQNRRR